MLTFLSCISCKPFSRLHWLTFWICTMRTHTHFLVNSYLVVQLQNQSTCSLIRYDKTFCLTFPWLNWRWALISYYLPPIGVLVSVNLEHLYFFFLCWQSSEICRLILLKYASISNLYLVEILCDPKKLISKTLF